ncbi:Sensor histidine kinase YycG [compost metagenome]
MFIKNSEIVKGNKTYYENIIYNPILNEEGEIEEIILVLVDVTPEIAQKKELEKILIMQKDFFSFISHEFRTPLTVITSAIQLIKAICKNELSPTSIKYINKINKSALQQLRLVNNLLDITKADSGYLKLNRTNLDIVSVTKVISESVNLFAEKKGIKLSFLSDFNEKIIALDDEKYERILLNLLSNAIKFTEAGKNIYLNIYQKEDKVVLEVRDEGVGIAKDKQKIIFDRFGQADNKLTRNSEGTGIGLCLVKLLVNALGGDINVISKEGEGSRFIVSLPDIQTEEQNVDVGNLMENRLVETMNVEFSNIYFEESAG